MLASESAGCLYRLDAIISARLHDVHRHSGLYTLVNTCSSIALPATLLLFTTRMVELYRPVQHLRRALYNVRLNYYPIPTRIRVKLVSVSGLSSRIRVKLFQVSRARF